jgi:integrase
MAKLNSRFVETVKTPGKYGDSSTKGLQLVVSPTEAKKWVFRFQWQGRQREMGLGSFPEVGLADAREKALEARKLVKGAVDPIADRQKDRAVPTFGQMADEVLEQLSPGFRNDKHRAQWAMTLGEYCKPIRNMPVDAVDTHAVLSVLKPHWTRAPETASRLRGRIERVLNAAKAKGYRTGENPATWKGHLENLLPKRSKLSRGHFAAMAYADVPAFIAKLRERDVVSALALEFCILTATRSTETLEARWQEIDFEAKVWTVPAERTKAARDHSVPLSDPALAILAKLNGVRSSEFVFPGRGHKPLSSMSMEMILRRMDVDVTVHGFRSSFRDWAGNETHFPREVAEHALAHIIGDKAEQAYRRSDALEKRRALMDAWANHCEGPRRADVIKINRRRSEWPPTPETKSTSRA